MKHLRTFIFLVLGIVAATASAQTDDRRTTTADSLTGAAEPGAAVADSLGTPLPIAVFDLSAPGFDGLGAWGSGLTGSSWQLHEGFNASLSMSITAGLGKHAPGGAGFGQSAAFAYALPLSKRFAAAVGVYADNFTWGSARQTDGGVAATLRYSVTPSFNVYAYGAKSFLPKHDRFTAPCNPFLPPVPKDRFGAMAEFKIGQSAVIRVSVEKQNH